MYYAIGDTSKYEEEKTTCTTVAVRRQDNRPNEIWKEMTKKALCRVTRPGKNINLRDGHEYVREVFIMQKKVPFGDGCRRREMVDEVGW
jgi:hypothetical protein